MKIISRTLMICTTITTMNALYAHVSEYGPDTHYGIPESVKPHFPMIEQYAPDTIKEVCLKESIIICPACEAAERMLWCAKKLGKTPDINEENVELYYYCRQCFSANQDLVVKIIDIIAHKASLNNDKAFALLKEFNQAVAQAGIDTQHPPHDD